MTKFLEDLTDADYDRVRVEARRHRIALDLDGRVPEMKWEDLHARRSAIRKTAAKVLDAMQKTNDERASAAAADLHDTLMALFDECQDEFDRRDAKGTKNPIPSNRPLGKDMTVRATADGEPAYENRSGWVDDKGAEVRTITRDQNVATSAHDGPSLGATLRAMIVGPRNEAERRALAEGTDSAGGYTVPTPLALTWIDKLRAKSVVVRAGAVTVPMTSETLSIARLETDPTVAWRAENASVGESDPTFGRVQFQARSLMGMVRLSRELLEDSVNVEAILENAFSQAIALEFDRACLFGSGSGAEPTGLFSTSGINSVSMGTNGAVPTNYDPFLDALYELQLDNAADPTAAIFHPRTGRTLNKLKDGDNNTLQKPDAIASLPFLSTTSVPITQTQGTSNVASTILIGDFTQMLLGIRNTLRIEVLKERYADVHQYAFVAHMRADMQVAHAESFCKVVGVTAS